VAVSVEILDQHDLLFGEALALLDLKKFVGG
jgi:hypothetical protein